MLLAKCVFEGVGLDIELSPALLWALLDDNLEGRWAGASPEACVEALRATNATMARHLSNELKTDRPVGQRLYTADSLLLDAATNSTAPPRLPTTTSGTSYGGPLSPSWWASASSMPRPLDEASGAYRTWPGPCGS